MRWKLKSQLAPGLMKLLSNLFLMAGGMTRFQFYVVIYADLKICFRLMTKRTLTADAKQIIG